MGLDVINLSSYNLSPSEIEVLRLGLSFCPSQQIDKFTLAKDLHLFARNLTYKYVFDNERGRVMGREEDFYKGFTVQDFRALKILIQLLDENESSGDLTESTSEEEELDSEVAPEPWKFKVKSQKFPNLQTCPAVWAFLKQTKKQTENFLFSRHIEENLSQVQQQALQNIVQNYQIIVKPSDKGGNVVVMDKIQYIDMCNKILSNQVWYQQAPYEQKAEGRQQFQSIITEAHLQTLIDKDLYEYLEIKWPITPTFYSIPKVHKNVRNPRDVR